DRAPRGGGEAAEAAHPEPAPVDAPPVVPLAQQQAGDEEPGEREEDRDAEEAAPHPPEPRVEQQDQRDGDGTQSVERGDVPERLSAQPSPDGAGDGRSGGRGDAHDRRWSRASGAGAGADDVEGGAGAEPLDVLVAERVVA